MKNRPKITRDGNVAFVKRSKVDNNKFVILIKGKQYSSEFKNRALAETCFWTHYYVGDLFN
jgi:hypothetical protein